MKYRILGKTGLRVSVIGLGTWQFGGEWGKDFTVEEVGRILSRGKDLGINLIDTAECYGDHLSESLIGQALRGQREGWVIATKFGHKFHGHLNRTEPRTPGDIQRQLEDSLRALQVEVIDLYQYHSWGDAQFEDRGVAEVLQRAKEAGKIRHIGNSIGSNDNVRQAELSEEYGVEALQVVYNRLDQVPEKRVFPAALRLNLGVLARVPLASGLLSGRYKVGTRFENPADVRHNWPQERVDERLKTVEEIRRNLRPDIDLGQWALGWCLQHEAVTCVIPGVKSVAQVEGNAAAAELEIVRADHPQAAG